MMTNSPLLGNPHHVDDGLTESSDGHQITKALEALAFEQRTANLIALANTPSARSGSVTSALEQIDVRLGFRDN